MSTCRVRLVLFLPLFLLAGCGGPNLAKVTGTVTYDDKPLAQGTIHFETPGARPATGKIVDGKIVEVTTYTTGDGVPVGSHKVAIYSLEGGGAGGAKNPGDASAGPAAMQTTSLIPTKYNDPEKSGLTAEVKSGGANELKFELKKNP